MPRETSGVGENMKIALVSYKYGGTGGGIERVVEELARRFCREHEVHVYAQSVVKEENDSIHFHLMPQFRFSWSLNKALFFFLSPLYLARKRYDIVHLHVPSLYKEGIVTCHGIPQSALLKLRQWDPERREVPFRNIWRFAIMRPIIEYNFREGNHQHVIAISSMIHDDLVSICKTPAENISCVPNGVDVQRFMRVSRSTARQRVQKRFDLSPDHFIFLFVGNFFERKGVRFLLPAFAKLSHASARLLIVGNPSNQNRWAKVMAEELGISDRVIFAGEHREVETLYAASDVFVFPSFYESFGLVLLEALCSGLPVIASRTGAAEDLIKDGENGFLLSSFEDVDELSNKMNTLLIDPVLRKQMGEKSRKRAMSYEWDTIAEETLGVYRQVIGTTGGKSKAFLKSRAT